MKKPFLICVGCLLAALGVMFYGFGTTTARVSPTAHTFILLAQEDTGSFLLQLRNGAEMGAADAGDKLTFATLDKAAIDEQIAELKASGTGGVLLYATDKLLAKRVQEACDAHQLTLTLLDRDDLTSLYAATDEVLVGAMATRFALEASHVDPVYLADSSAPAIRRLRGAADELNVTLLALNTWYSWGADNAVLPDALLQSIENGACIVTLTADATIAAISMKAQGILPQQALIISVDPGAERATLLESGEIRAMLLPQPYTMGYLGIQLAREGLTAAEQSNIRVAPRLITLDNLYDAENVKVAFPLLE